MFFCIQMETCTNMKIEKVCNNSVAIVTMDDGKEMVVTGRGICFGKKPGDTINEEGIEKTFVLENQIILSKVGNLLEHMPEVYLTITEEIVNMIKNESDLTVSENIYITLMDHISLSLEREKKGVVLNNPLLLDIKHIYKKEYELAYKSRRIIEKYLDVRVSDNEIGFIALHIVNAEMNQQFDLTMQAPKLIQIILDIVQLHFHIEFNENSFHYERFLRHLQFFVKRVLDKHAVQESNLFIYYNAVKEYPDVMKCVDKLVKFVEVNYEVEITNAEKGYLAYHIVNALHETKPDLFPIKEH